MAADVVVQERVVLLENRRQVGECDTALAQFAPLRDQQRVASLDGLLVERGLRPRQASLLFVERFGSGHILVRL